ncbi:Alpha-ketoglutarate-dependent dioxygenase alkB 7 [Paragonimus skrjabini miyazakii]|uniref:Alpha-ketoglutarate-dependent dioxygenase alkB 7 n=1 Tax=Paragonimus skrjabini miyazakii TaxID=59628 RepID=A0A8S9Z2P9_9TREM|nr:Alpha-ketoglutarate-dependent dioxygenase alkB 7 [Paragonimus skrjabini miyazakii]
MLLSLAFASSRSLSSQILASVKCPSRTVSWRFNHEQLAHLVSKEFIIKPEFISVEEEKNLVDELDTHLLKHRYQDAHWDYAITHYRETERKNWRTINRSVIERLKEFTAQTELPAPASCASADQVVLPHIHILDLAENGEIKPHVDSVRASLPRLSDRIC